MKVKELLEGKSGKGGFIAAMQVACPLCKAKPGKGCVGIKRGEPLATVHNERLRAAGFGSAKDFGVTAKAKTFEGHD